MADTELIYPNKLTSKNWARMSCALEKPYVYTKPSRAHIAYIDENAVAHYGKIELVALNILVEDVSFGPAIDISIAYDARWSYTGVNKFVMYTINDPYIALIDSANNLYVLRGPTGSKLLLQTHVDRCWIVRGWKHVSDPVIDQGLVVFYLKQGKLYSRSYIQQSNDLFSWTDEESYDIDMYINDIQAYRTKDFRLAIACSNPDLAIDKLVLTDRVFPGQSIQDESLSFTKTSPTGGVAITAIEKVTQEVAEEITLSAAAAGITIINDTVGSLTGNYYVMNDGNSNIVITSNINYEDFNFSNKTAVSVVDGQGLSYAVLDITATGHTVNFNVSDMGNSVGDITISYSSGFSNSRGYALKPFTLTFTPKGLIPSPPNPPVISDGYNTGSEVIS